MHFLNRSIPVPNIIFGNYSTIFLIIGRSLDLMQFSFKHLSLIVDNQNAGWSFIRCSFIGWSVICRKVDPPSIHDCNRCNFGGEHLLKIQIQIQIQIQIATVATLVGSISRLLPNRFHPSTIYPASTTYQINIDITYRKTEGIQSYLRIWGTYDPIESDPSEPKKWGLYNQTRVIWE